MLLCYYGAKLNLRECRIFTDQIYYLGQVILLGRLEAWARTIDANRQLKYLTTMTESRSF